MNVVIIDYGMGNLKSVQRAFEECGSGAVISDDPKTLKLSSHIVLPGVGAFGDAMANLRKMGWVDEIKKAVRDHVPVLGICLGMQLLADKGYEGGETEGLGLIAGEVKKFVPVSDDIRIPHVGWNEVYRKDDCRLLAGISDGSDFYFVHSYRFIPKRSEDISATTPYCGEFVSVISKENVFGVQFHPEKSSRLGFKIIQNFIGL